MNKEENTRRLIAEDLKKAANDIETASNRIKEAILQLSALQSTARMPALTEIANRLGWLSRCIESERAEMKTSADENKDHKIAVRRAFAYNLLDAKSSVNVIYTYLTQALDITRFNDAIDSNDVIAVDNARDMLKRFQKRFIKSLQNFIDIYND